jgi:hypothetical protein
MRDPNQSIRNPMLVDLSAHIITSTDQLWDLLAPPCGLPVWFGRNLDAWHNTLRGGVSELIDAHENLIIRLRPQGLFAADDGCGQAFVDASLQSGQVRFEFVAG